MIHIYLKIQKIFGKKQIMKNKLKPKCLNNSQSPALTNTGILLPCCWLDNLDSYNEVEVKKLFNDKKIDDVNNVDEIINGKVWTNFFEVLKNESITVPKKCYQKCTNNIKVHSSRKRTIL